MGEKTETKKAAGLSLNDKELKFMKELDAKGNEMLTFMDKHKEIVNPISYNNALTKFEEFNMWLRRGVEVMVLMRNKAIPTNDPAANDDKKGE